MSFAEIFNMSLILQIRTVLQNGPQNEISDISSNQQKNKKKLKKEEEKKVIRKSGEKKFPSMQMKESSRVVVERKDVKENWRKKLQKNLSSP